MLDCTDRFARYFLRLLSRHTLLYTEMVTTAALLYGDPEWLLEFDPAEHPVALQLGGSEPDALAECAKMGSRQGYDEINLNLGCPSSRVQSGRFGACLMREPELVADCIRAMKAAVDIPVTVKTRLGVDEQDSYQALAQFIDRLAAGGCDVFIIHARKAWLQGLSPRQNREIPPLRYDLAERLKCDFPELEICINGGITTLDRALELLRRMDGVMIGRAAYHNPWLLAEADRRIFHDALLPAASRKAILIDYLPFMERELGRGTPLHRMTRHLLGLFQGLPGARAWRSQLSTYACRRGAGPELVLAAARLVKEGAEPPTEPTMPC